MARSPLENVVGHWHQLIENFETSPKDFYTSIEVALDRRQIPGLKTSRVKWSELGILSPDREYLRVSGDRYSFDMCAAPFGTGFFFSYWVTKKKARWVLLYCLLFFMVTVILWRLLSLGMGAAWNATGGAVGFLSRSLGSNFVLVPLAFFLLLWSIALASRAGITDPEAAILALPGVAWFYQRVFAPETYYRIDTMLMFQEAVHNAMQEVIGGLMTQKGLRGLSDDERKPVFHKLM